MSFVNSKMNRFEFIILFLLFNNIKSHYHYHPWQPAYSRTYGQSVIPTKTYNPQCAFNSNILIGCEPKVEVIQSVCNAPPVNYIQPVKPHEDINDEKVGLLNPTIRDHYLELENYAFFVSIELRKSFWSILEYPSYCAGAFITPRIVSISIFRFKERVNL